MSPSPSPRAREPSGPADADHRRASTCLQTRASTSPRNELLEHSTSPSPSPRTRSPSYPADADRLRSHTELYRHAIVLPVINMLHVVQRKQLYYEKIDQLYASGQSLADAGFYDDRIPPMSPTPTSSDASSGSSSASSAAGPSLTSLTSPSVPAAASPHHAQRPAPKRPPPSPSRPRSTPPTPSAHRHTARSRIRPCRSAARGGRWTGSRRITRSQRCWDTEFVELDASGKAARCDKRVRRRQAG